MREILFRGKQNDNGEWIEGYYAIQSNHACFAHELKHQHFIFKDVCLDFNLGGLQKFEVIPETVGQYTGLNDKNGKKIFEGDILKVKSYDYEYEYLTKVFHNSHTLCVDIYGQDYDYTSIGFADDIWDDEDCEIEVIGNIHDNPELLLGGDDK